jgi:hypothetical protein
MRSAFKFSTSPIQDSAYKALIQAGLRDSRFTPIYATIFAGRRAQGGELAIKYSDISPFSGSNGTPGFFYGSRESIWQSTSPRGQALQQFIAQNPCWWSGCVN